MVAETQDQESSFRSSDIALSMLKVSKLVDRYLEAARVKLSDNGVEQAASIRAEV